MATHSTKTCVNYARMLSRYRYRSSNLGLVRVNINLQRISSQVAAFSAGSFGTRFLAVTILGAIAGSPGESLAETASL